MNKNTLYGSIYKIAIQKIKFNMFTTVNADVSISAGSATGQLPGTESLTGQLSAIITVAVVCLDGAVAEGKCGISRNIGRS